MKKRFSIFVILGLLLLTMVGCGSKDRIVGKWGALRLYYGNEIISISDSNTYIDIKSDGTLSLKFETADALKGKWELAEEYEDNTNYTVTWDDGGTSMLVVPNEPNKIEEGIVHVILVIE